MRYQPQQPQYFAQLAQEFNHLPPHFISRIGLGIIGAARRQNRIAVNLCNGYITQEQYDKKHASITKLLRVLALELQAESKKTIGFVTGGDPRGAAIKLVLPSGICNDFGREGYIVPEGK